MPVYLHHLETIVPETYYRQDFVRDMMKARLGGKRLTRRLIHRLYAQSGIEKRHSVIRDFDGGSLDPGFYASGKSLRSPSTKERNDLYMKASRPLYTRLAHRAIAQCPGISPGDISHVITVSCTGFFAPGPDYYVVKDLCLSPGIERFHLGFMGCYAAFPAMKMAQAFCQADPDAIVLVLCLELCSLHLQPGDDLDALIAASVFADGAAAAVVSARKPRVREQALEIRRFHSALSGEGEEDMAWTIGNAGFEMVLSSYLPELLEAAIEPALKPLLEGLKVAEIEHWAIHPGGRAILDRVQEKLGLSDNQLFPSRQILREYGNMSSATILFVLKEIARKPTCRQDETVCAMAFGPGLTVESGLFIKNPAF